MNPIRAGVESAAVGALAAVAVRLSGSGARRLGRTLGALWHALDLRHRRIARENLRAAFPDLSPGRRAGIARESFRHFGYLLVDMLRFPTYDAAQLARAVRTFGIEHLDAALARGKGALLITGHYGNWELAALAMGYVGRPMDVVARPLDNQLLERRLRAGRERSGNRVIHKRSAIRSIIRSLREGRSVAIVIDQNFRDEGRVFVEFFGRPAATTPALGLLAFRTGAPVVPVFAAYAEDGKLDIRFGPEVRLEGTGDRDADGLRLTQACTRIIEDQIRRRPECWLWMHQRWRTRPAAETGPGELGAAVAGRVQHS